MRWYETSMFLGAALAAFFIAAAVISV